jgi:hypothetical protein
MESGKQKLENGDWKIENGNPKLQAFCDVNPAKAGAHVRGAMDSRKGGGFRISAA